MGCSDDRYSNEKDRMDADGWRSQRMKSGIKCMQKSNDEIVMTFEKKAKSLGNSEIRTFWKVINEPKRC